jgi:hypothetical protein
VQIRAADAGLVNLDQDVIDANRRLGRILQPKSAFWFRFDEGFHG